MGVEREQQAPWGASGESRVAAMIADPGQIDMAEGMAARLGDLSHHVDDPAADDQFEALLQSPALKTLFGPRMVTNGVSMVRAYVGDMRRYTSRDQVAAMTGSSVGVANVRTTLRRPRNARIADKLVPERAVETLIFFAYPLASSVLVLTPGLSHTALGIGLASSPPDCSGSC